VSGDWHHTNTAEILAGKARARTTIEAWTGTPAPADPDNCYKVTPGGPDGPEHWARLTDRIKNVNAATGRAIYLSMAHGPQTVTRYIDGTPTAIRRYAGGAEITLVPGGRP